MHNIHWRVVAISLHRRGLRAWSSFKTPMSLSHIYSHPLCTIFNPSKFIGSLGPGLQFCQYVLVIAIKANQPMAKTPKVQLLRARRCYAHFEYTIAFRNVFLTKQPDPIFEFRPRFPTTVVRSWLSGHFSAIFWFFRAN